MSLDSVDSLRSLLAALEGQLWIGFALSVSLLLLSLFSLWLGPTSPSTVAILKLDIAILVPLTAFALVLAVVAKRSKE